MKLIKFRVTTFRSVDDSGWVDADNVTALIGINEAGKTNLLLPLWKLNPAKNGEIEPLADYPRSRYNDIRSMEKKPVFIRAQFELNDSLIGELVELTGATAKDLSVAEVTRNYDGQYGVSFPHSSTTQKLEKASLSELLNNAHRELEAITPAKSEESLKHGILTAVSQQVEGLTKLAGKSVEARQLNAIIQALKEVDITEATKRGALAPRCHLLFDNLEELVTTLNKPTPNSTQEARTLVHKNLPKFVYYSNYGNLDSEIYLPHVIENLKRNDLGGKESAKARTLKVLFDFVQLEPEEILQLGQNTPPNSTQEQISNAAQRTKEREVLLQSASNKLTKEFRDWWKQGTHNIRFQADGNHFRIWVSDQLRPEELELEARSTGLQWFLSFFLVFLVERDDSHDKAILLLDEPGLSLHPLAQEDLSAFFENLSIENQIVYTTHSPSLVDTNHLDRVRVVYVNEKGATCVSPDLRIAESQHPQSRSVFPVHAALQLSMSRSLFQGGQPVIVEGMSDQFYLSAMKTLLIGKGLISPSREIFFVPGKGTRSIKAIVAMMCARDEELPVVLVDSDSSGIQIKKELIADIYAGCPEKVLTVQDFTGRIDTEVEDMLPLDICHKIIDRYLRGPTTDFSEGARAAEPLIPQIEVWAKATNFSLPEGWKVELARRIKQGLLASTDSLDYNSASVNGWKSLFSKIISNDTGEKIVQRAANLK